MNSIETKEISPTMNNLAKAKAKRVDQNVAVQPVGVMVENKNTPAAATPAQAPAVPATPVATPASVVDDTRDYKESWKHLKTKYDSEIHAARQKELTLEQELAKAKAPKLELPKNKEEMEAYRKQYPEAMDVFQTLALETFSSQSASLRQSLDEVRSVQAELKEKEAFNRLLELHPDAIEIRQSPAFHTWFNEQPKAIQDILEKSSDVNAVAKQIKLYKLEVLGVNPKEVKKAEAQSTVDASLGVPVTSRTEITAQKKIWTQTEINAISADYKTWLKYRVELDDARREGRIDPTK